MKMDRLVPALLFLSGASALIYEVVWSRLLTFTFGGTAFAISTVLAAYMAGLALGSWLLGRRIDRAGNPLVVYAQLEAGVALWALLLPLLLAGANALYRGLYSGVAGTPTLLTALRFTLSFLLLVVPTALMGGTLPVLLRLLSDDDRRVGERSGLLLGANTAGAVVGTLLGGFVLIPALGLTAATGVAVVFNLLVAGLAWSARGRVATRGPATTATADAATAAATATETATPAPKPTPARRGKAAAAAARETAWPPYVRHLALVVYALSGCAALMCEVGWTRVLAGALGTTTYAFSTMLATFLLGLALGSFLFGRLADRGAAPWLAWTQLAAGALCLALVPLFGHMPLLFLDMVRRFGLDWGGLTLGRFLVCGLALLGPTLLFGAAFPLVARLFVNRGDEVGAQTGQIYAANTGGAIVGSLLAGFVLIPHFGRQSTLIVAGLLSLTAGLIFLLAIGLRLGWRARVLLVLTLVAGVPLTLRALPPWDRQLSTSGAYAYASAYAAAGDHLLDDLKAQRLVEYKEETDATLAVWQRDQVLSLRINGKADASTGRDMLTQKLLAHVPLCYRPAAQDLLVIGLGSGVSVGSALTWPAVRRVDCIELLGGLREMARHFADVNNNALADPRTHLLINDGRNHLLLTRQKYDVIVSEPSNPWISGIGALFTRQFFKLGADHLNEGGVFCQWVQTYQMSARDLGSIIKTFHAVYPNMAVWMGWPGDLILVGSTAPLALDYAAVAAAVARPALANDLEMVGLSGPEGLLAAHLGGNPTADALAAPGGPVATDDNLLLEFSMPRHLMRPDVPMVDYNHLAGAMEPTWSGLTNLPAESAAALAAQLNAARAGRRQALQGIQLADSGQREPALRQLREAQRQAPHDGLIRQYLGQTLLEAAQQAEASGPAGAATAAPLYQEAAKSGGRTDRALALNAIATALVRAGQVDTAATLWQEALTLEPKNPAILVNAGFLAERQGNKTLAEQHYRNALLGAPRQSFALAHLGTLMMEQKRLPEAVSYGRQSIAIDPTAENLERYGWSLFLTGDLKGAETNLRQALAADPNRLEALFRLGGVLMKQGRPAEARQALQQVAQRAGNTPLGQLAVRALQGG